MPVHIYSDCISAIGVTEGSAGHFRGIDLAARCRHMMQAVKARIRDDCVAVQHVKSHVGHVGNEIADYFAKACCRPDLRTPIWCDHPICLFLQRDWLTWLWLYVAALRDPQSWPRQIGGSLEDPARPEPPLPSQAECTAMLGLECPASGHTQAPTAAVIEAALLTVNVQSLCPDTFPVGQPVVHDDFPGKAGLLREQLTEWHISVAALQETRAPRNETIQSKTHIRFCSARDAQGSYGTELWFSKTIPFIRHDITLSTSVSMTSLLFTGTLASLLSDSGVEACASFSSHCMPLLAPRPIGGNGGKISGCC